MPWLNRIDRQWLSETVQGHEDIFVLDDHSSTGGLGDRILKALHAQDLLRGRTCTCFGVEGFPACGTPPRP